MPVQETADTSRPRNFDLGFLLRDYCHPRCQGHWGTKGVTLQVVQKRGTLEITFT